MSDVFIYQADIYCRDCGRELQARIILGRRGHSAEASEDSDDYPQGPYSDGGGEADTPQHCARCREFLENPLTGEGYDYMAEAIADHITRGSGLSAVLNEWAGFYTVSSPWHYASDVTTYAELLAYAYSQDETVTPDGYLRGPGKTEGEHVSVLYWSELTGDMEPEYSTGGEGAGYFALDERGRAVCGDVATGMSWVRFAWDELGFEYVRYLPEDEGVAAQAADRMKYEPMAAAWDRCPRDDDGNILTYGWQGGSQLVYTVGDDANLGRVCSDCAQVYDVERDEWTAEQAIFRSVDAYEEGPPIVCDQCGGMIESDYGDPDASTSGACPMCGAENEPMGTLGYRACYSCRQCGEEYTREVPRDSDDDVTDMAAEA